MLQIFRTLDRSAGPLHYLIYNYNYYAVDHFGQKDSVIYMGSAGSGSVFWGGIYSK